MTSLIKDTQFTNPIVSPETIRYIRHLAKENNIQGLSIALVKLVPKSSAGQDRCQVNKQCITLGKATAVGNPINPMSLFALGSDSKLFTAIAVGMLIHRKVKLPDGEALAWESKMKDMLPVWKLMDEYASQHATLIDVLSMRSGPPTHVYAYSDRAADEIMKEMQYLAPTSDLREKWQYNNQGYIAVGQIFPLLIGQTLVEFVRENILDPLGMANTFYDHSQAERTGRRTEAFVHPSSNVRGGTDRSTPESVGWFYKSDAMSIAACGGLISCAKDMAIWTAELLNPHIVPSWIIRKITQAHSIPSGESVYPELGIETYGLGQYMSTYKGVKVVYHQGTLPGFNSLLVRLPDEEFGVALMSNDACSADILQIVSYRIIDDVCGVGHTNWTGRLLDRRLAEKPEALSIQREPNMKDAEHQEALRCLSDDDRQKLTSNTAVVTMIGKLYNDLAPLLVFTHLRQNHWTWTAVWVFDSIPQPGKQSREMGLRHWSGRSEVAGEALTVWGFVRDEVPIVFQIVKDLQPR